MKGVDDEETFEEKTGEDQDMTDLKVDNKYAWLEPYCALYRCEPKMLEAKKDREPFNSFRLGAKCAGVQPRRGKLRAWREAGAQPGATRPSTPLADQAPHPDPCATDAGGAQHLRQHHGEENGGSSRLSSSAPGRGKAGPT